MMIEVTRGCLIIVEFKNDVINDLQSDSLRLWVSKTWQVLARFCTLHICVNCILSGSCFALETLGCVVEEN